jgi:hypothetical protein
MRGTLRAIVLRAIVRTLFRGDLTLALYGPYVY